MSPTEIVLTGGPCAGKSTGLLYVSEKLRDHGFRVFTAPEAATLTVGCGLHDLGTIAKSDPAAFYEAQRSILRFQRALRAHLIRMERIFPNDRIVILYDRAEMDGAAYLPREQFEALVHEEGLTIPDIRDHYAAAFHLLTAANGAESFYTLANNAARHETPDEAREKDRRTLAAWIGTPHLRVVDNSTDFEHKLRRLLQMTSRALGVPVPLEIERKFLLRRPPDFSRPELRDAQKIEIEQIYLRSPPDRQTRIRHRKQHGGSVYYKTVKIQKSARVRLETEIELSASLYFQLAALRDPETGIIRKSRYCFTHCDQYFELDVFHDLPLCFLEIELTEENAFLALPPFLDVERELTDEPAFSNFELSKRIPPP
ncbi:MAG: AAA family ATPase [Candidatus Niyogibacteria bacterium]|nr:AAA family ATPase [Candidatus Niyogibacteria bacterium]